MIEIIVNGEPVQFASPVAVAELVEEMALHGKRIAVEVNGEIVPASHHAEHQLQQGDQVEIVGAIGGG
jgi:sulfur carrier protein